MLVANGTGKTIKSATVVYFRACLSFKEFYFDFEFDLETEFFLFLEKHRISVHWYNICKKSVNYSTLELEIHDYNRKQLGEQNVQNT